MEEMMENALHKAGGISDDNYGTLQKISWSRAGRTDKGVHAVGQLISVKLILSPDGLLERANAALAGSNIAILGMERTTNNFVAHTACTSREYEYLLPVSILRAGRNRAAVPDPQPGATEPPPAGADQDNSASKGDSGGVADGSTCRRNATSMRRRIQILRSRVGYPERRALCATRSAGGGSGLRA